MTTAAPSRPLKVAIIGNPNAGKSSLFNALAGLHSRVGNYPGVTVEKKVGRVHWGDQAVDLIDLPGTYSLSPRSLDEMISVDVLLGHQPQIGPVDAVICIADAANLERHLFLLSQVLDLGQPTVLVLNMWDTAESRGVTIDVEALRKRLKIPVVVTEAHRRKGMEQVREAVLSVVDTETPELVPPPRLFPEPFYDECLTLRQTLSALGQSDVPHFLVERMLLDVDGRVEQQYRERTGEQIHPHLVKARERLTAEGHRLAHLESEHRFRWARNLLNGVVVRPVERGVTWTERIDAVLTHRVLGLLAFAALMFVIFQAIYLWAEPMMVACEETQGWVSGEIEAVIAPGPLRSLLVDGIVAGIGSALIFLPQIMLLFLFIAILEDCGYMARAAFLVDRVMAAFGLSGKSFLPLMSSFACAVPGIMATRSIEDRRVRMVTILIAPLMSCSARLPVYLLLIGAFVPAVTYFGGAVSLQGLILLGMVSLGALLAIPIAWLMNRTVFRGEGGAFVMELPTYKIPSPRLVAFRVWERAWAFLSTAGTLIFATTILVWAAGYFPGDRTELNRLTAQIESIPEDEANEAELAVLAEARNAESARLIEASFLGRAGKFIEPAVKPLGWDWKIGVGVIASFPAREVIIATLGTIYSLGGDVDEEDAGLRGAMRNSTWPDGTPVFNLPVALSVMVFFALCAQCASTLMILKRETNSWSWTAFSFVYMTGLAYVAAFVTYQVGMLMTGA